MALPAIIGAIPTVVNGLNGILDRFIPNKEEAAKAEREIISSVTAGIMENANKQIEVNTAEANSGNWFAAGWRPLIGYVCGLALFWNYCFLPICSWALVMMNIGVVPPIIPLDGNLWELMFGMLGLGALRTVEKFKGVSK